MSQPIRVLVAKPGLDGHDRGALVIAQGLRDQGMEVIYTGLRQTPGQIVATAIQEDVACVGLSSLSGAHMALFPEVVRLLREQGAEDILVLGGGVIPEADARALEESGVAKVFGPGTRIEDVAEFIRTHVEVPGLDLQDQSPLVTGVDHIGVVVTNLEEALPFYTEALGLSVVHIEMVNDQQVRVAFVNTGSVWIELLEPTSDESSVAKFLTKRGPGLHHVAYSVQDIHLALDKARQKGFCLLDETPRKGAHGKWVAFVHPKSAGGVLTEFCQAAKEEDSH